MTNFSAALNFMNQVLRRPDSDLLKKHFLEDISYRSDRRNRNNRWVGLLEYRIVSTRIPNGDDFNSPIQGLILTSSKHSMLATKTYIEQNSGKHNVGIVFRDDLVYRFKSVFDRLRFVGFVLRITCITFIKSTHRLNMALCIREVTEWARLAELLETHGLNEFIDFSGYEKDSNALTAFLQSQGIHVTKVPSPGPLYAHYKFVLADTLVLSSAYQQEEKKLLSANWHVKQYCYWPPEQSHTYAHVYTNCPEPELKTIGFYSHGEWLRRMEGHADPGLDILENEESLLSDLSQYLQKHKDYKLIIFPHPKERKSEHTQRYYERKLAGVSYSFSPEGVPSAHLFHSVDVGLMAYSTLIFERIGMGYKTFIAKYTNSTFPVKGSALNALLFNNAETLENQLLATENETRLKYFERNNLSNHLISNFTNQL